MKQSNIDIEISLQGVEMEEKKKKFGETLIEKGVITEQQLKEGLSNQKVTGRTLGETLVRLGFVTREIMNKQLTDYYGAPWLK